MERLRGSGDPKQAIDNMIRQAQGEAEKIIATAKRKADEILDNARIKADQVVENVTRQVETLQTKAEEVETREKPAEKKKTYALAVGRSDTVVVHCSDPRFQEAFQHFVEDELKLKSYDPVIVPGASQLLALYNIVPKFSSGLLRYLEFLIKEHSLKKAVIIMHEDCAWYKKFVPGFVQIKGTPKEQQIEDMLMAKHLLLQEFPELEIRMFFAGITPDKKVEFSEILEKH